jgi:predicted transcriptional regulator
VVSAYVSNNIVPAGELPFLIADIHKALGNMGTSHEIRVAEKQTPAVAIKRSVQDDQITCLECGLKFKSLKRHLMSNHTLSPAEYRAKWELTADYPMVAPAYAEARSRLAKTIGLGQKSKRGRANQ